MKVTFAGMPPDQAKELRQALSEAEGRLVLSGSVLEVCPKDDGVGLALGGHVQLLFNPPTDPIEAELLR